MAWIKFKGVSSDDMALIIRKTPQPQAAAERVELVNIPGVDGDLSIVDGTYEAYDIPMECTLTDDSRRFEVFAWLRGAGNLETQHKPGYVSHARVASGILPEHIAPNVKNFMVNFHCQPFWFEAVPTIHTLVASGSITNPGTRWSLPIITVTGTGVLTVNGTAMTIAETGVVINSEIEECYIGTANKNDKATGGFPHLDPGVNAVTLGAGITQVVIVGNYRWY